MKNTRNFLQIFHFLTALSVRKAWRILKNGTRDAANIKHEIYTIVHTQSQTDGENHTNFLLPIYFCVRIMKY